MLVTNETPRTTFDFFYRHLSAECSEIDRGTPSVDYISQVLTSFATHPMSPAELQLTPCLAAVLDQSARERPEFFTSELYEVAAEQMLLLGGFFRRQMRGQGDVHFLDKHGENFYRRASFLTREKFRREIYEDMARRYAYWTSIVSSLEKRLTEYKYLIVH